MTKTLAAATTDTPAPWAEQELGSVALPDQRLKKRLWLMATQWAERPTEPLPKAGGSEKATKGAYRFLEAPDPDAELTWQAHRQSTLERAKTHRLVLAAQDTVELNYTTHPATEGLGPTGDRVDGPQGLWMHHVQAFTPEGIPLGLLGVEVWARDPEQFGKAAQRYELPLEAKESAKWGHGWQATEAAARQLPATRFLSLLDSEGDVYEVMLAAHQTDCPNAGLLVRLHQNRRVVSPQAHLLTHLRAQALAATIQVRVPRHEGQPARTATLEIRFDALTLRAPKRQPHLPALPLYAVEALEPHPPAGVKAICWRLLSTWPVTTAQEAIQCVQWYTKRWGIEVYHKILKSGCKVEERQLQTAGHLQRMLALFMVVAWRIMALNQAAHTTPELPISEWLEESEWRTLVRWATQSGSRADRPPSVRQAVLWIAQLGGFRARKCDGEPGVICLWRGLTKLHDMTLGYKLSLL